MEENVLSSLKGRVVQVYKGGPESKKGKLLAFTPDYLILQVENGEVIYYKLHHVKSVIEDAKYNSDHQEFDKELQGDYIIAKSFQHLLVAFESKHVQIDRGGPESVTGVILKVKPDFLVINTLKDGILYYNTKHIKSVSVANGKEMPDTSVGYFNGTKLDGLFPQLRNRWVSINRGGPEAVEGILSENAKEYILVVNGEKISRVSKFHIRNVNIGSKDFHKKKNEEKNEEDTNKNEEKSDNNDNKGSNDNKDSKDNNKQDSKKNSNNSKKRYRYSHFQNGYNPYVNTPKQVSKSKMVCDCKTVDTDKEPDHDHDHNHNHNDHKDDNHKKPYRKPKSHEEFFSVISTNSTETVWTLHLEED